MRAAGRQARLGRLRGARRREGDGAARDRRRSVHRDISRAAPCRRRDDDLLGHEPAATRRHDDRAVRSGDDRGPREPSVRVRGVAVELRDAVDRAQRAERRRSRDAVDAEQRAVPRQRAGADARARCTRRAAVPARQPGAVHRQRRGRGVVAVGRAGRRRRTPGLLQRHAALPAGADRGQPPAAGRVPPRHRAVRQHRHPGEQDRADARLPERAGDGRPRAAAAPPRVVRGGQVAGAVRAPGRRRAQRRERLVVGLGHVQRSRTRPRQARRRLRVPLGAQPGALQRSASRGTQLQRLADAGPAPPSRRRHVPRRAPDDLDHRDRADQPARAGSRRRLQRACWRGSPSRAPPA